MVAEIFKKEIHEVYNLFSNLKQDKKVKLFVDSSFSNLERELIEIAKKEYINDKNPGGFSVELITDFVTPYRKKYTIQFNSISKERILNNQLKLNIFRVFVY